MDASPDARADPAPDPARETAPAGAPDPRAAARAEVLEAAARCFMDRGFSAASIDDVARAMGATKGRVYHYYRSKLDLFADVVRWSLELIHGEVVAAEGQGAGRGAPTARMGRMIRAHVRSILRDQPFHRVALQGVDMHLRAATTPEQRAALADLIALRDRHEKLFERVLREGIAAGEFAPRDPGVTVRTLLPALNGAVFWYRPRPGETEADRAEIIETVAAFALAGLAAQGRTT